MNRRRLSRPAHGSVPAGQLSFSSALPLLTRATRAAVANGLGRQQTNCVLLVCVVEPPALVAVTWQA